MSRRSLWLLAALTLILAVGSQWWFNRSQPAGSSMQNLSGQPIDYALSEFRAEFYSPEAALELIIEAPRLEHLDQQRQAIIHQPRFELLSQQPPWLGSAQTALIDREHQWLDMTATVVLRQRHAKGEILVQSEHIRYDRSRQQLHSPESAQISQAGTELHGGTLTLWLDEQRAELNNDVQGIFRSIADRPAD
ncbi:MAG: LPS export ABC transporter periplasmic protein LptC [Pseudomonadota bacterium]